MSALFSRRLWGRNECVTTTEPQRTSAGRLQFKSIEKFIQGIRKSHLNFASKAFKASKYGHGTVQPKIVHMQEVMQEVVVPQNT